MATTRFGHLDDFTLKNSKVGIGTSDPTEALEVIGGSRSKNIEVTGIATLTSYEGFQNKKTSYVDNVNITGGESGTLSGEIVIGAGLTMSVGTGATTGQGSIKSLKVSNTFTPPIGGTVDRPTAPQPGAIFYNKDFRTIEYWDGNFWRQVDNVTTSGRAVISHGYRYPAYMDKYDLINIPTTGNATYFGDHLYTSVRDKCGCGSQTRGLFGGGITAGGSRRTEIDYITIASEGKAADFGDLIGSVGAHNASCSSQTRGIWHGGYGASPSPAPVNLMDYVEIQTLGNALDFGDLFQGTGYNSSFSGPTRGFNSGGYNPPAATDYVQMFTIAAKGNAIDFGTLTALRSRPQALANTIMGFTSGGLNGGDRSIDRTIIASGGQAIVFGDSPSTRASGAGTNTQTRGIFAGGGIGASPGTTTDDIEYFNLQSGGTVADFGNLTEASYFVNGTSDSHGGLGGF